MSIKSYAIAFGGLKSGTYHYDFKVDDAFFQNFPESEITGGDASVSVEMNRSTDSLTLQFAIKGHAKVVCDRCLEEINIPFDFEGELTVRFADSQQEYDGETMWISKAEGEVNVAQYIYESIVLSLPYLRVHPNDENGNPTCDADMLSRFKIVSEDEFEEIVGAKETQKIEENNPMWEKLKELKEKL